MRREDDDDVFADFGEQVQETMALDRIEAGGRLVDDESFGAPDQRDRDAEPLLHSARESADGLLARVPEIRLLRAVPRRASRRSPAAATPLSDAKWSSTRSADRFG